MNKNRIFTEEYIWNAVRQASDECMDDCEYSGLLILAEAILGIPYAKIKSMLDEGE